MIDLTPLEVRKKKGDFRRGLRGYDPPQVDDFLDVVADRLEAVVRENVAFHDRIARLEQQVTDFREREKALTEALVTAQEMREEMRAQSEREADLARRHAEQDAARIRAEASQLRDREEDTLRRLRARQLQFLNTYRAFLERELSELESVARGLELNGAMSEPPSTPPAAAVAPSGARSKFSDAAPAARTMPSRTPVQDPPPSTRPAAPAAARGTERTAFAAGMAGASVRPPEPRVPAPPEQHRPSLSEWAATPPAPEPKAAPEAWSSDEPSQEKKPAKQAGEWAATPPAPQGRADSWDPLEPPAAEPELILSDDDVLADPDLEADMDILFGGGPTSSGGGGSASPSAGQQRNIGLDLVPEFEDFAALGQNAPSGVDAADPLGGPAPAAPDKKAGGGTDPANPRRRPGGDDDPEDLLSALFGDDR